MTIKEHYRRILSETSNPQKGHKHIVPPLNAKEKPTVKKDGDMKIKGIPQSVLGRNIIPTGKKTVSEATKTGIRRRARDMQIAQKYSMNTKFASSRFAMDALKKALRNKAMKAKGLDPVGAKYESVQSNGEMLLNELGDTPAGRKALHSYIAKRAKQIRGPMSQRISDIGSNLLKGYDNIEYRNKVKLPNTNAVLATVGLRKKLQRALQKKERAETGISRAMNTLYPRTRVNEDLLNEIGDTARGQQALRRYILARAEQIPGHQRELLRIRDRSVSHMEDIMNAVAQGRFDSNTSKAMDKKTQTFSKLINRRVRLADRISTGIKNAHARLR